MATLSGNKIKDTYQSLIKLTDNGNLTTGAKQLTDGFGNNSPLYLSTTQIGIGVTPEATYDLHVYSNAKVGGNLTVTGDLTVEGTTTTIDTQTLTVEDPLIEVASNNTSTDAVDIGWYGKYAPSGTVLYAGLFRDTGDSKFKLFRNLEEQPTTTINTSGTGYTKADLVIGNLEATQVDLGDSEKIRLGASQDIQIYYDGTTDRAYFNSTSASQSIFAGGSQAFIRVGGTQNALEANHNGNVSLNYSGATKLNTTSAGVDITGNVVLSGIIDQNGTSNNTLTGNVLLSNATNPYITISDTTNNHYLTLQALDAASKIDFLSSLIFEYGASNTEAARLNSSGLTVTEELTVSGTGQSSFAGQVTIPETPVADTDAASKKYVDDKFEETDTLAEVLALGNTTGGTDIAVSAGDDITFTDTSKAYFGAGNDLQIYHDGSFSDIWNYTGDLRIRNDSNDSNIDIAASNEAGTGSQVYIRANGSTGAAELFHYSYKKLETTSTGVSVTGDISIPVSNKLFFGGGNHTYIGEDIDDRLRFFVGGAEFMRFTEGVSDTINFYQDVTFSGDLIVPEYIKHEGDADTSIRFTTNTIRFYTANNEVLELESDGQVNVISSGTATNPCITIGDDVNTGIWRPASDTFAISTAGTERMRIDSSGQIKTQNRNFAKESNYGYSSGYKALVLGSTGTNTSTDSTTVSINYDPSGNAYSGFSGDGREVLFRRGVQFVTPNSADDDMFIYNLVLKDGNAAIGTNSPQYNLHAVTTSNTSYVGISNQGSGTGDRQLRLGFGNGHTYATIQGTRLNVADDVDIVLQGGGGDVGIGVTSPVTKLDVRGGTGGGSFDHATFTSVTNRGLKISTANSSEGQNGAAVIYNAQDGENYGSHAFQIAGSTKMFIKGNNVGIGTDSPDGNLTVRGANDADLLVLENTTGLTKAKFQISENNGLFITSYEGTSDRYIVFQTGTTERMRITSGGDVLIGKQSLSAASVGFEVEANGIARITKSGDTTLLLNRLSNDGVLVDFRKDTVQVGTISTNGNSLPSDRDFKKDITNLELGLDFISTLAPKKYRYKISDDNSPLLYGIIAQDLEQSLLDFGVNQNEAVLLQSKEKESEQDSGYSLDYLKLTPVLINAIKELKADNDSLRARIEILENN